MKTEERPTVETDEVYSFAGSKHNKVWIWLAIDHYTRQIVGAAFGDRSDEICLILWQSLPPDYREYPVIYTYFGESYWNILPPNRLCQVGKKHRRYSTY